MARQQFAQMRTKPLIKWKLLLYLLSVGSFIFLAIEGGASQMQQRTLASTNRQVKPAQSNSHNNNINNLNSHSYNVTLSPAAMQDVEEVRDRCVENIWDVTVSLNVLYRENWTRYAWSFIFLILCEISFLLSLILVLCKRKSRVCAFMWNLGFSTREVHKNLLNMAAEGSVRECNSCGRGTRAFRAAQNWDSLRKNEVFLSTFLAESSINSASLAAFLRRIKLFTNGKKLFDGKFKGICEECRK